MDRDDLKMISYILVFTILFIGGAIYGISYAFASTYAGIHYDVIVTVQAIEHSDRFYPHTNVWCLVYGDQNINYCLYGFQDFFNGRQYHISFTNRIVFTILGFEIVGDVSSIQEVK